MDKTKLINAMQVNEQYPAIMDYIDQCMDEVDSRADFMDKLKDFLLNYTIKYEHQTIQR